MIPSRLAEQPVTSTPWVATPRQRAASWHPTFYLAIFHTCFTYTRFPEVFSILTGLGGFPGLFLYLAALYFCFKVTRTARRQARLYAEFRYAGEIAFTLQLTLLAFTITAIFAGNAYYFYFPMVAGLCAAFERATQPPGWPKRQSPSPRYL